jgi:hypothetical protein
MGAAAIDKPCILITSLGRTGTQFLARLFGEIMPDSVSLHEPDIFQGTGVDNRVLQYLSQARVAGLWRMGCLKLLGKWTLTSVSDARFLGRLGQAEAAQKLVAQRRSFIHGFDRSVYVEANVGYYGLLDVTPRVFAAHRAAYFVRDPREWIRSHMNWGELYGKRGLRGWVSHKWPGAPDIANDPYAERWSRLSRFQKLCWAWARLNQYGLGRASQNPNARVFRFEDVFSAESRYRSLEELIAFLSEAPGARPRFMQSPRGWLERPIHQSSHQFPEWRSWPQEWQRHFETLCGPLMEQLGYRI